ncbi:MAG: hypothetical protein IPJ13_15690 [Saprospiraceae bacterium]|nr:hypothetical protein [Saprospiraceae bacterium]
MSITTAMLKPTFKTKYKNLILQAGVNALYSSDDNSGCSGDISVLWYSRTSTTDLCRVGQDQ